MILFARCYVTFAILKSESEKKIDIINQLFHITIVEFIFDFFAVVYFRYFAV